MSGFRIMGVVNVTPDSFSDGGRYLDARAAIAHGLELELEGAAILDIGGESTRPGADPVGRDEELRRVLPVIEGLKASGCKAQISIDTSKSEVAAAAMNAGVTYVNDVTAFRSDPELADVVASAGAECCLMHMLGDPRTMQDDPHYDDVVSEIKEFLEERMAFAISRGIERARIMLDPGIGFGKTLDHNLELLRRVDELAAIGQPLVIGTSRKSFLGRITGRGPDHRAAATIATNVLAYERGARVFRVHDVAAVRDALAVTAATVTAPWPTPTISTT
jgi:dihydropteroate synthase